MKSKRRNEIGNTDISEEYIDNSSSIRECCFNINLITIIILNLYPQIIRWLLFFQFSFNFNTVINNNSLSSHALEYYTGSADLVLKERISHLVYTLIMSPSTFHHFSFGGPKRELYVSRRK